MQYFKYIKKNLISGLVVRPLTLLKGIVITPIALNLLGIEEYGLFQVMLSVFGFAAFFSVGVSPSVTYGITRGETKAYQSTMFCASALLLLLTGTIIAIVFIGVDAVSLFNRVYEVNVESHLFYVVYVVVVFTLVLGLSDAIRAGFLQHYIVTRQMGVVVICQILLVLLFAPAIDSQLLEFFLGVSLLVPLLIKTINMGLVLKKRRYFICSCGNISKLHLRNMLSMGSSFFVIQFGIYMATQFLVVFVGGIFSLEVAGVFQINNMYFVIYSSFVGLYTSPLASVFHKIRSVNNFLEYRKQVKNAYIVASLVGCFSLFLVALWGGVGIELWVGKERVLSGANYFLIAVNLFIYSISQVNGAIFSANEKFTALAKITLLQMVCLYAVLFVLHPYIGVMAVFVALVISTTLLCVVQLVYISRMKLTS